MEKYYKQIIGMPVTVEHGPALTRILDLVLNTSNGKIVAFLLSPSGNKVVAPIDVVDWGKELIIHDYEDVLELNEIQQVKSILAKKIKVYRNKVMTKDGIYLGRVVNFAVHTKFLTLTKIVVAKSFLRIFNYGRLIINSADIIEIKKDAIIVKNLVETASDKVKKLSPDMAPTI